MSEETNAKYPSWVTHTPASDTESESFSFKIGDAMEAVDKENYAVLTAVIHDRDRLARLLNNVRPAVKVFVQCVLSNAIRNSGFARAQFTLDLFYMTLHIVNVDFLRDLGLIQAWQRRHPDSGAAKHGLLFYVITPGGDVKSRQYCMKWADEIIAEIDVNDLATQEE